MGLGTHVETLFKVWTTAVAIMARARIGHQHNVVYLCVQNVRAQGYLPTGLLQLQKLVIIRSTL